MANAETIADMERMAAEMRMGLRPLEPIFIVGISHKKTQEGEQMNWKDVSEKSRDVMNEFGGFVPSKNKKLAEVTGLAVDCEGNVCKVWWTASTLREIAAACTEVADWLDKRAKENK